ncbi:ammonium transporter [Paludisphaera borealis]|uniref:Ammonium transporter n=1 Tax=Paludisphaera borealis TaxID=1387353 RepID=A0A1U7CVT3_9BACT|nr:ammonium transporter [Paludisphaera borealis]APW63008.1 Ammonium transporter NrgA [Paludisphaera borealis]
MISPVDTLLVVFCTALVMLMTPALGLFFGGMVRRKNVLATFQGCFILLGAVALQWLVVGHGLAFGRGAAGGWIGVPGGAMLGFSFAPDADFAATIPQPVFLLFELTVAVFAAALISGAVVERVRFGPMTVFILGWTTLVYDPVAHWVWAPDGWLKKLGVHDFAGGLVVHATAGVAALCCALILGKRRGLDSENLHPHNLTLTAIGSGLLWFGWIGLNTAHAWKVSPSMIAALAATILGGGAGMIAWSLIEQLQKGKVTLLGTCTGAVAGLVGVSPAAGYVTPLGASAIGLVVSALCYAAVAAKRRLSYDDSLDVFGVHGVGGVAGLLAVGLLADPAIDAEVVGLFQGNADLIAVQFVGAGVVVAYTFVVTAGLLIAVDRLLGLRASPEDEELGLDLAEHGQRGYILGEGERLGA